MGMTIDKAQSNLRNIQRYYVKADNETIDFAIDILRKYQQIQEVMDSRPDDDAKSNSKALSEIEVIMYADND